MPEIWAKFDHSLAVTYSRYLKFRDEGSAGVERIDPTVPLALMLEFSGDLAVIEQHGFVTRARHGETEADGTVHLADLEAVAGLPEVRRLRLGMEPELFLDLSVPGTKADKVWTVNKSAKNFSGQTGKGVVIGIIDSGIDFLHDFFLTTSTKETRIQRIWDMGLVKKDTEKEPNPLRLGQEEGTKTYGVEYTASHINAVLQGKGAPVRHRDCMGHGTHVASIAAGNGRPAFTFVGMAPEADLIIVKIMGLETEPPVFVAQRFYDAVNYILNIAKDELPGSPAVVINYSIGLSVMAHDGLSREERFINSTFTSGGRAIVVTAGNNGRKDQHAELLVPAGGKVMLNFVLVDERPASSMLEFDTCKKKSTTMSLGIWFWYPVPAPPHMVDASFNIPGITTSVAAPPVGPVDLTVSDTFNIGARRHSYSITHANEGDRNYIAFSVDAVGDTHAVADYSVELSASEATTVHAWARQPRRSLKIKITNGATDRFQIGSPGGAAAAITVAAYSTEKSNEGKLADFSSRGPLVDYLSGTRPVPMKPDIAAPGVAITAALSRHAHANPVGMVPAVDASTKTVDLDGTSMSAPHVTGAVALLLGKNKTLTALQIKALLRAHFTPRPPDGTNDEWGAGILDAEAAYRNA